MVKEYDGIIIGSGAGMNVGSNMVSNGMRIALLEHDLLGGTCLNVGCIPTKIIVGPADAIREAQHASKLGVTLDVKNIDVPWIMERMQEYVREGRGHMETGIGGADMIDWYRTTGEFVGDHTMKVGDELIHSENIIIASGSRLLVPPIEGIEDVGYLDNISALALGELPKSLIVVGGGYIAAEFGHFFSAMGTRVTMLGRNPRLLKTTEPEVSEIFRKVFSRFVDVHVNSEVVRVERGGEGKIVWARDRKTGEETSYTAEEILMAPGRRSNTDLLKPEKTGVEVDRNGWIKVNEYLQTTAPGIWALGDAIGVHQFRHTANYESDVVWQNGFTDQKVEVDYHAVPYATFSYPRVAGVGLTEAEALKLGKEAGEDADEVIPQEVQAVIRSVSENLIGELPFHHKLQLLAIARCLRKKSQVKSGIVEKEYAAVCEEHDMVPKKHTQFYTRMKDMDQRGLIRAERAGLEGGGMTTMVSLLDLPAGKLEEFIEAQLTRKRK